MLATKAGDKVNGCITNTCMQVANDPTRVAFACINRNYTCELIKESGIFALTLLDQTCTFQTISHFGFQTGREVDKFADMDTPVKILGDGELSKPLTIKANAFSKSAASKIAAAGGTAEVI